MKRDYWPTKGFKYKDFQFDENTLKKLNEVLKDEYSNITGIMMIKDGYCIFEQYYNGITSYDKRPLASVSKSILSALFGIALDMGYIKSVDEPISNYLPDYNFSNSEKRKITLKNILNMTAPFDFPSWDEPLGDFVQSENWTDYAINLLSDEQNKYRFKYSTIGTHLLSVIITNAVGIPLRRFANKYLFDPIGMDLIPYYPMNGFGLDNLFGRYVRGWIYDPQGYSIGGFGINMNITDMAKFGFLYLNNGKWDDKQIISEKWIKDSFKDEKYGYGYLWWLYSYKEYDAYCALGIGGQCICVIPKLDLVIAISSGFIKDSRNRWMFIRNRILPFFLNKETA
ncbi:MAG: serine hydrolase [Lagierella massiliensis]|nr:serine hydrolase [Lagierella massiliensis]